MARAADSSDLLLPGDLIFEKYRVDGPLTKGGMDSHIFTGVNITLNPNTSTDTSLANVVIKIVKRLPQMKENNWIKFLEEVVTATRVQHANLVQTYDVIQPNLTIRRNHEILELKNVAVIVMENINGPSLRSLLSNKGYFSVDEAMYYFEKIVLAVRRLHTYSHMIIHRDLKPENILLTPDLRELKIVDFGISSSVMRRDLEIEALTDEQSLFGTVDYMSPDNLEEIIDPKTKKRRRITPTPQFDFHSMGVILFEMLTGEKPFIKAKEDKATIKKAKFYDMPSMRGIRYDIPNSIENIVFRCVASKREDLQFRYNDCEQILKDVETYNLPERINEPLLKPVSQRVLERPDSFNPSVTRLEEKFFYTKWMFILITVGLVILAVILIVLLIFFFG
ncbi:serine/threonine protein kinase [[Mycoplasma] testudinis]|uniref:serine/threonine protein kinase n=1 Tax=[Mycoplasma] testudinis TaxID=33924 RepID=UPI000567BC83|nr:serine/threonine-protein kinase [[Mycoplasma] testudinis]